MPNIGATELLIVLFMLGIPVLIVVAVVLAIVRSGRSSGLPSAAASPGWLADPTQRHQQRYWDGTRWTAAVSDDGAQASDPI
jgi:hypothetical protein